MANLYLKIRDSFNYLFNNGAEKVSLKTVFINTVLMMILIVSTYVFLTSFSKEEIIPTLIVFIISLLITQFFLNNFKCSSSFIIRMLQQFLFMTLLLIFSIFTLHFTGIIDFNTYCEGTLGQNRFEFLLISNNNSTVDTTPSPTYEIINSVLENGDLDIPIVNILHQLVIIDYMELACLCLIIYLFISHYLNKYLTPINQKFFNKLFSFFNFKSKHKDSSVEKVVVYNERFIIIMFILTFLLLLIIKIAHIFVSVHLFQSIDSYVYVYNKYKNSSSLLLIGTLCNNYSTLPLIPKLLKNRRGKYSSVLYNTSNWIRQQYTKYKNLFKI